MLSVRQQKAIDFFNKGYNCAQSVVVAFSDDVNLSEELCLKVSSAFGGGFARTRDLCGAVSAMGIVAGLSAYQDTKQGKAEIYHIVNKLAAQFKEQFDTTNCGELLKGVAVKDNGIVPEERTPEYYAVRPCARFVSQAVEILEQEFFKG